MSTVYFRFDRAPAAPSNGPNHPDRWQPAPNAAQDTALLPTCLSRNPACENARSVKDDGSFHRLCDAHRRQQWSAPHITGPTDREQLHAEPLPFELIPFDSGQHITLRLLPLGTIDDLQVGATILTDPVQGQVLEEDTYFCEYF